MLASAAGLTRLPAAGASRAPSSPQAARRQDAVPFRVPLPPGRRPSGSARPVAARRGATAPGRQLLRPPPFGHSPAAGHTASPSRVEHKPGPHRDPRRRRHSIPPVEAGLFPKEHQVSAGTPSPIKSSSGRVCNLLPPFGSMTRTDRSWMRLRRSSDEWQKELNGFLDSRFQGTYQGETASCPCTDCNNITYATRFVVQKHLLTRGFHESFIQGEDFDDDEEEDSKGAGPTSDGAGMNDLLTSLIKGAIRGDIVSTDEEPNERAKKFLNLLKEAEKELYPGCKEATKISFIVRLFQIKCMYGLSNSALGAILHLFSLVLPKGHCISNTLDKVRKVVRDLGLDYHKIHACINDCVLYRRDYEEMDKCPVCGESRWKTTSSDDKDEESSGGSAKKRAPRKILRYFPL